MLPTPRRLALWRPALLLLAAAPLESLLAQDASRTRIVARPGAVVVLDSAGCVRPLVPPAGGAVEAARVSGTKVYAIYRAPAAQSSDETVTIETGAKEKADNTGCEPPTPRQFSIGVDRTPEVPAQSLQRSFTILLTAFVLATLLESAFALLFNWRLFQEYFVGRAWRTPIMFVGALLVVRHFDLDVVSDLLAAYDPRVVRTASSSTWLTSVLTAMILAGGSVGVNRILVALGFRSQIRPDLEQPLNQNQAWISIRVRDKQGNRKFQVAVDEVDPAPSPEPPTTVGLVGGRPPRDIRDFLFPNRLRIPRSGGLTVDPGKTYRITIVDRSANGKTYDALGREVAQGPPAALFRFAPRSIVDFDVTVP
jgi:hypothetical protein